MVDRVESGIASAVELIEEDMEKNKPYQAPEQAELLPLAPAGEGVEAQRRVEKSGKVGRPRGAVNRKTQEWADYLLSRYPSPLQGLAEIYSRPVKDLARELGFEVDGKRTAKPEQLLELLKVQISAADKLAPYLHSKMPVAIDTGDQSLFQLTINAGGNNQQNQSLSGVDIFNTNAYESNDDYQDVDYIDENGRSPTDLQSENEGIESKGDCDE